MTINAFATNGIVVVQITETGGRPERFVGMNPSEAHDFLVKLTEAIGNAQGQDDALTGKVTTPSTCTTCGARKPGITHRCKRVRS